MRPRYYKSAGTDSDDDMVTTSGTATRVQNSIAIQSVADWVVWCIENWAVADESAACDDVR